MAAYLNRISTVVPPHDVHATFVAFARGLLGGSRVGPVFERLVQRSQIEHRWSVLAPAKGGEGQGRGAAMPADAAPEGLGSGTRAQRAAVLEDETSAPASVDADGFYTLGVFPSTAARMRVYEQHAGALAARAVAGLELGDRARDITHVIAVSCTGLAAPGIDLQLIERCGLDPSVERTVIGFMGCYAAINGLKTARHIVRSDSAARVLVVCVELCTLHLQQTDDLEKVLSFLVFGDGCAAALVTADPTGLSLDRFKAVLLPDAADQITWGIGDQGFDMVLSGQVPGSVGTALRTAQDVILDGATPAGIDLWAVHPGGRSVLDAVQAALDLPPGALEDSREVLRQFGNMSSATVLFVLARMMARAVPGQRGCAMAFGPGLTAETLLFRAA